MSSKKRIELECHCTTCKLQFNIWNIEELIGKEIGSGIFISRFKCPNCEQNPLVFDLVRGKHSD